MDLQYKLFLNMFYSPQPAFWASIKERVAEVLQCYYGFIPVLCILSDLE